MKVRWRDLQSKNTNFFIQCFGIDDTFDKRERSLRFGEEAIELLQATGLQKEEIYGLIEYVYRKKPDAVRDEFADVQITLLALATAYDIFIDDLTEESLKWANKNIPMIQSIYKRKPKYVVCSEPVKERKSAIFD